MKLLDNWKCDQLRWRHYGRKKLQTSPVVSKTYYTLINEEGNEDRNFKKFVYTISGDSNKTVVIHYKGDDSVTAGLALHVRTFPSTLRDLEKSESNPSVAYKHKISTTTPSQEHIAVELPRNRKQIKNLQSRSGITIDFHIIFDWYINL